MTDTPSITPSTVPTVETVQPTSTATTSVTVPATQPPTKPFYASYDGMVGAVIFMFVIMTGAGKILDFIKGISEFFERKKRKDHEQDQPLVDRITKIEDLTKNFRSNQDLDRDFNALKEDVKHIKQNRAQSGQAAADRFRVIEQNQSEDRLERAKLEAKVDGMVKDFSRVESAVEKLAERIESRLDAIQQSFVENRHTPTS